MIPAKLNNRYQDIYYLEREFFKIRLYVFAKNIVQNNRKVKFHKALSFLKPGIDLSDFFKTFINFYGLWKSKNVFGLEKHLPKVSQLTKICWEFNYKTDNDGNIVKLRKNNLLEDIDDICGRISDFLSKPWIIRTFVIVWILILVKSFL